MKHNKEKGFTLVELIVVIAVASVLLVGVGLSLNTVFSNKAKSAARNIYNMLGTAQNLGMSKENIYFAISTDNKGEITISIVSGTSASNLKTIDSKVIGKSVPVKLKLGSNEVDMSTEKSMFIKIDRKTGGFGGTYPLQGIATHAPAGTCTQIDVGAGSNYYGIKLYPRTGKIAYL